MECANLLNLFNINNLKSLIILCILPMGKITIFHMHFFCDSWSKFVHFFDQMEK